MSLVIKKFAEGGSPEVRLYKRGNDEVDLNAFVRQAEAGFNDWLDKADIKEKHKKEVRAAYQDMITRINDDPESFVARLGGGFTNTAGITNKTKGFDAYGIAAGYLGNTLRGMSVYTKPEVKSDKPKYKKDAGFITSAMQSQIWGDSPESFIRLDDDSFDEATGQRDITNRVAQTVAGLGALKGRLRDYYDFDSDDDYNHAVGRIDSAIASLQNANPNDDWFTLGQLGITGMDRFFSTGRERRTTPLTQEEQTSLAGQNRVRDFENWMSSNRPFYTGTLDRISLNTQPGSATAEQKTELMNKLNSLSTDDLKNWIFDYIENPNYDFTHHSTLMRLYGGVPAYGTFTPSQIMSGVLTQAIYSGLGKKISDTMYYFPDTLEQHSDGSSTVYVYNLDSMALEQVDTQDVADYRKQYMNEYKQANPSQSYSANSDYSSRYPEMYPSHKEGGILKAQLGAKFDSVLEALTYLPEDLSDDRRLRNVYNNGAFTQQARTTSATDIIHPGNNQYDPEPGGKQLEQQDYYKNWLNILITNPTVAEAWARRYRALQPTTKVHYSPWFNEDDSFNFDSFKNTLVNNKKVYSDAVNGIGHDFYRGRVYQEIDQDGNPLEGYYDSLQDGYELVKGDPTLDSGNLAWIYQMRKKADPDKKEQPYWETGESDEPDDGDFNEVTGDSTPYSDGKPINNSELDEVVAKLKDLGTRNNPIKQELLENLGTDLIGAGRLIGSIRANNRIARTVRESLRPKLHDTYELYSPVTGAFSEMQLRNRQGAETLSQSYRPFTSNTDLAAARMLEGQRYANDLQYQGFLADDKEIKRTQAEALKRQEDNIARRSALINENRDAIITNNQAVAQLEASRVKQNWQSIDNYLGGIEGRMRQKLIEDRDRRSQFALQTSSSSADQWRRDAINQLRDKYEHWKSSDPTRASLTFTDWATQNIDSYTRAIQDINAYTEALKYRGYADAYGLKYEWPTYKDDQGNKKPIGFDINSGRYKWLKSGGVLKPNSSQLIDKIIRKNNEGNS